MSRVRKFSARARCRAVVTAIGATVAFLWNAGPAVACSVCYGNASTASPLVSSARTGVFLLLGFTLLMLAALTRFFFYLRGRAIAAERDGLAAEWTNLQRSAQS